MNIKATKSNRFFEPATDGKGNLKQVEKETIGLKKPWSMLEMKKTKKKSSQGVLANYSKMRERILKFVRSIQL
ncbi:hypothetical protein LL912_01980 [Niabella sp. CC-SYL272]|uniref:hypothetical protein n=1 Tax=Niabella agricola TaxID=2891571 RepID=UPI001F31E4FD|nr:hypothetical protein [Niabella agricola]MCF3107537.1 hypothetical protein [Niabella agricola]